MGRRGMKPLLIIAAIIVSYASASDVTIEVRNKCRKPIWPGIISKTYIPLKGGFQLNPGQSNSFTVPSNWNGTIWIRTRCDEYMNCATGFCGNKVECNGMEGEPPFSKAEFQFDFMHYDHYYVSLLEGYNINMTITPAIPTYKGACQIAGACEQDLKYSCPMRLRQSYESKFAACKTACQVFDRSDYCCRGIFDNPSGCQAKHWDVDYPGMFKQSCYKTLTYKYDMLRSTYACPSETGERKYVLILC